MNNFQNRLLASVSELELFPSLGEAKGGFIPSLSLQLFGVGFAHRRHRITTSASGSRFQVLLAKLFFGQLSNQLSALQLGCLGNYLKNWFAIKYPIGL
ncbi:MAG: hypothetical protein V7K71_20830 [Nostoc sp.]|uniref:hypothetical protein n=1 Tax=Nostoc sp. TaxID=1180 RepID=UPI002FF88987